MDILKGIRIVDMSQWAAGPEGAATLAELGAEVIHVERLGPGDAMRGLTSFFGVDLPVLPDGQRPFMKLMNRLKKDIAVDFSKPEAREIMYRILAKSDVFIHNLRPESIAKRGLDYQTLSKRNPRLIYVHTSGYGPRGPEKDSPAFDMMLQARGGIMEVTGERDMPPVLCFSLANQLGGVWVAFTALAGLLARDRLGIGQEIEVSQLGGLIHLLKWFITTQSLTGTVLERQVRAESRNPLYNYYECKDGKWIALGLLESDKYWSAFCKAMGITHLEKDPKFADIEKRMVNCQELIPIVGDAFKTRTSKEWIKIFKDLDFPFSPIQNITDVLSDPQAFENNYIVEIDDPAMGKIKWVGFPIEFTKTPVRISSEAAQYAQHTEEVLSEICGYTWKEITSLRDKGVI